MKPANQEEKMLYARMGEAICKIQVLEQALSHCLTVKLNPDVDERDANVFLSRQQSLTFGMVVKLAAKEGAYSDKIQKALEELLAERNWLVHHAMLDSQQGNSIVVTEPILQRIKSIASKAEKFQLILEWDLVEFAQSKGRNISKMIEVLKREKGEKSVEFQWLFS
ncbi:MAG: hypothetical protein J0I32_09040 [Sphingobacteriales bacterium]|nr:hypothetical protein [Sphingobacteriales bacterium]OJW00142.1 MAG: hypothetical protein BGO52_03380 [Sphingobacteriales bacterium 44-61]